MTLNLKAAITPVLVKARSGFTLNLFEINLQIVMLFESYLNNT